MKTSKIVQLLKTFTPSEWTSCGKYLAWQFKESSIELRIFYYLKSCKKNWDTSKLNKEVVKQSIAKKLTDKDFLSRRSKLKLALEAFLLLEAQKDKERKFDQQLILGELYKKRGLYNPFKDLQKEIKKGAEKLQDYDLFTDLKIMQWHHQRYFSETLSKDKRISSLKLAYNHLERFYQSTKLFYDTETLSLQLLFNLPICSTETALPNPLKTLLIELDKLVSHNRITSFECLKKDLIEHTDAYSAELQQVILLRLINTCNAFLKNKRFTYKEDIIDLFEFGLKSGIMLNNGKLSEFDFFNMVDAKSKSNNVPEYPTFIEKWLALTETKHRETLLNVAYAQWHFANESFKEALDFINFEKIVLKDTNVSLRVRIIKLCCLASLEEPHENFSTELENAKAFFREKHKKKEVGKESFMAIKNLITIIEMIWKEKPLQEIRDFKDNCRLLSNEFWIESRLKKMAQKR